MSEVAPDFDFEGARNFTGAVGRYQSATEVVRRTIHLLIMTAFIPEVQSAPQQAYSLAQADRETSKLSGLQKFILRQMDPNCRYRPSSFLTYFGFSDYPEYSSMPKTGFNDREEWLQWHRNHDTHLWRIRGRSGHPKYRTATAAIARAIRRLKQRGLVERNTFFATGKQNGWSWVSLTEEGSKWLNMVSKEPCLTGPS